MEKPSNSDLNRDLGTVLRRAAAQPVAGFSQRVVEAVRVDRFRRRVIRWSSVAATLAACFIAAFVLQIPSAEDALIQQTRAVLASDESAKVNAILGVADDLNLLTPVIDKQSSVVDDLTFAGF